jgi:uncharacterized membrane protein
MNTLTKNRIESIDVLRGIVMIIMALDHVRDYFHVTANTADPLNIEQYNIPLFATRWITHFCAPIFVFLSGTSIYLQSLRKTNKQLAVFVIKRGVWLIVAEWTLIAFAWTFNPFFNIFPFQVIWAIGISMVLLGVLLLLNTPYKILVAIGFIIVLGHNALDFIENSKGFVANFWWDIFHTGVFKLYTLGNNRVAMLVYPFVPWLGIMLLGFGLGKLFESKVDASLRKKTLTLIGITLLIAFVILRYINIYGNPTSWEKYPTTIQSFLSFINVTKYPPSLLYSCITIGMGLLVLAYIEKVNNAFTAIAKTFGRTAFFYYILHLYLIHIVAVVFYFLHGNTWADVWNIGRNFPFLFVVPGKGENLLVVYLLWIAIVIALYPLCKWYDGYKTKHKEKWWLSYL